MSEKPDPKTDRRRFIQVAGGASALGAVAIPQVFAQAGSDSTIQVALIGCGGRGTGAAANALSVASAPLKLVAMADVFPEKLSTSHDTLVQTFPNDGDKIDVPHEQRYVGFDAYKKAMDVLRPGDIALFATPPVFRWVHFQYAIERGLNVFMEKPIAVDGPTADKMMALAKKADAKNLKCGVGLMVRHCRGRRELYDRIRDGEIGDLVHLRAYRMHGPVASCFSRRKPPEKLETMWQIERFHSFLWASGGLFSDFYIHQIDEVCWMKDQWPVKAYATGGRHFREDFIDQNFDNYAVEYEFADGSRFLLKGRTMTGCHNDMSSVVHGTKGSAIVSTSGHTPGQVRTFSGQRVNRREVTWAFPQPEPNPYQLEWDDLVEAILNDQPYNEVARGAEASLVTAMGRMAAHTGQAITYEQMRACPHEFAPGVDQLTPTGDAPVMPDADGKYPVPNPGVNKETEYEVA